MANKNIIKQFIFSIKNKIFLNKHPVKQTKNQFNGVSRICTTYYFKRLTISSHLNDNSQQINQNWFAVTLKKQFLIKAM